MRGLAISRIAQGDGIGQLSAFISILYPRIETGNNPIDLAVLGRDSGGVNPTLPFASTCLGIVQPGRGRMRLTLASVEG